MGNKICDGSDYNTKECGWDGGDCLDKDKELWKQFPKCVKGVDPLLIGNGKCDNGGNENTEECGWDGGECFAFNLEYPNCNSRFAFKISNGICEDAMRRVGFMNSQKVEPAPKIFAISSSFGRKVFGNYPLYDSTQPTICIPVQ
ncbi:hypothetical protein CTEN210_02892 [Chaetoceros tenuissimus]|uniref:LNR domain-containing protein n=1 Tax=Chaetoceros tenuissimus TaxID=426638 RepID=A0AAD3CID0_9STRA|nr:hypothetical protein CTEN210_02892 [Chaetoceros tenuissimus]